MANQKQRRRPPVPERFQTSQSEFKMRMLVRVCVILGIVTSCAIAVQAALVRGCVRNPWNQTIASARIQLRTQRGSEYATTTRFDGGFLFPEVSVGEYQLVVLAAGYRSQQQKINIETDGSSYEIDIQLEPGGIADEITVTASSLDLPLSQTPSSVTILDRTLINRLELQNVSDALRYIAGLQVNQTGRRGASTAIFARGGESDFNLVLVDGVRVNEFGGNYDFSSLPTEAIERIEVVRGPQSALYGSNAISSVVNVITQKGTASPTLDLLAEGGSFGTRRLAAGGQGTFKKWRLAANIMRLDTNGMRPNDDYHNKNWSLNVERDFGSRHSLALQLLDNRNEVGSPGPFGSDPMKLFAGLDTISRSHNQTRIYRAGYRANFSDRFRSRFDANLFSGDFNFDSPYGPSTSEHQRNSFRNQNDFMVASTDILSFGVEYERESFMNTYVTDDNFEPFRMRRRNYGYFLENQFMPSARLLISMGLRLEDIRSQPMPSNSFVGRPRFSQRAITAVSPKLAIDYTLHKAAPAGARGKTLLRASWGRGLRAPSGFELAFTDNPKLNPERSNGFDIGLEQLFLNSHAHMKVAYFYNRFDDLIVTIGGAATVLSKYYSDNLANARSQGIEVEGRVDLTPELFLNVGYSFLDSSVLALDGSSSLAPAPFKIGQPLLRRPRQSISFGLFWRHGRWSANIDGYARSRVLDVEPNWGASGGLFYNPGYLVANAGFSYRLIRELDLYARLNNFGNRKYEESFGYPSLPLNFVSGLRWRLPLHRQ